MTHPIRAIATSIPPTLRVALVVVSCGIASCAARPSSMVDFSALSSGYRADFFVHGPTVAMRVTQPGGSNLVPHAPQFDGDRLVFDAGVWSGGSSSKRIYCFDVGRLSPPVGWQGQLFWRNRDGQQIRVPIVHRGDIARRVTAGCGTWISR